MSKRDTMLRALCKQLGPEYSIRSIDYERCIYRDFGNGFNVEVSGVHTASLKKLATIYLWYGDTQPDCMIVRSESKVPRDKIGETVNMLYEYSEQLISAGKNNQAAIARIRFGKIVNCMSGGEDMRYRFTYGGQQKMMPVDTQMFTRNGYVCKCLFQNKKGIPVAVSRNVENDIWKVESNFFAVFFPSYEEAMEYCRERYALVMEG